MPDSRPKPPGFVLLQTFQDRLPIYIAIDEISRFTPYDRYRPGGSTQLTMTDGDIYHIYEGAGEIAQKIVDATTTVREATD